MGNTDWFIVMLRFGPIVFASVLLLAPGVSAGLPQASQNGQQPAAAQTQSSDKQGDDQGGPPTLRYNKPGSQTDKDTASPDGAAKAAGAAVQPDSAAQTATSQPVAPPPENAPPLSEQSKLQLLRYVDGEFAKVLTPLPGGKSGYHFKAGAALSAGDSVQITRVEFHDRDVQIDINNGPKGKTSWRERIHVEGGLGLPVSTGTKTTPDNAPVVPQKTGATIFLDFDRSVPDMTGEQLKAYLARVLDFSKRSAAVQYTDSLPPKFREAVAAKRAEVGMDHDAVTAALGRPERKVRERDADGNDIEDWIYGKPPAKTTFVRFEGDKVVRVTEYP